MDGDGDTALSLAEANGHKKIVQLLTADQWRPPDNDER